MVHLLGMFVLYSTWPYMSMEVAVRERIFRRPCPILSNWLEIVTIHPVKSVQIVGCIQCSDCGPFTSNSVYQRDDLDPCRVLGIPHVPSSPVLHLTLLR